MSSSWAPEAPFPPKKEAYPQWLYVGMENSCCSIVEKERNVR
jgi:hypothetical protein